MLALVPTPWVNSNASSVPMVWLPWELDAASSDEARGADVAWPAVEEDAPAEEWAAARLEAPDDDDEDEEGEGSSLDGVHAAARLQHRRTATHWVFMDLSPMSRRVGDVGCNGCMC